MPVHLSREIEKLKKKILSLCGLVEESVWRAVKSVQERDAQVAQKVIDDDFIIDQKEVEIEEDCLKILALHQPVAIDLRFITAVFKMNNDLERIADEAVNIAEKAVILSHKKKIEIPFDLPGMVELVRTMLSNSLDALVNMNVELARKVCASDDQVDAINKEMYDLVKNGIRNQIEDLDSLIHLLCISRHLERIADLATNIAEDVIYMVKGEIIRHKTEEFKVQEEDLSY